jgi:hypothetical protein
LCHVQGSRDIYKILFVARLRRYDFESCASHIISGLIFTAL